MISTSWIGCYNLLFAGQFYDKLYQYGSFEKDVDGRKMSRIISDRPYDVEVKLEAERNVYNLKLCRFGLLSQIKAQRQ